MSNNIKIDQQLNKTVTAQSNRDNRMRTGESSTTVNNKNQQ